MRAVGHDVIRNMKPACNPIDLFAHGTCVGIDVDRCHQDDHYALPTGPATGVRHPHLRVDSSCLGANAS
jgi:hypothetical protein